MAVVTVERARRDTQHAFDGVAATYDRSNAENPLLCAMRLRTRAALQQAVPPGSRILNLGCGPGTDDVYFARLGYHLTAVDWSAAMVDEARRRIAEAGLDRRVAVHNLGIDQLELLAPLTFDAAYSSFGALNCVADLETAARAIAQRLRPGGVLVASVIGRVCPWELALYSARGAWRRAALRFSSTPVAVPLEGRTVWTQYYTPGRFVCAFRKAGFERVLTRALGLLVPPPYMTAFAGRRRALIDLLQQAEDTVAGWPGVRTWGDHFLVALRRT